MARIPFYKHEQSTRTSNVKRLIHSFNSNEHCRVMEFLLRTPIIDSILSYLPLTVTLHYGLARWQRGDERRPFCLSTLRTICDKKSIAKRSLANVRSESRDKRHSTRFNPLSSTYISFFPVEEGSFARGNKEKLHFNPLSIHWARRAPIPLKYKSRNCGKLITMKQPQMKRLRTKVP